MTQLERLSLCGYRRVGTPERGFRWIEPDGRPAQGEALDRLRGLGIPPAWTEVHASPSAGARLQAVGRDRAGRWQYRYEPGFTRRQEAAKFRRLIRFAEALPRVRAAVERDLLLRGLPRERVLAAAVRLLGSCFMRAGSKEYAERNQSYGIATLRKRHVTVKRDLVRFDYTGKSGRRHVRELRDLRVARLVREMLALPGRELFQFLADDGPVDVRRRHINRYVKEVMGGPFTAKDFRTWAGTVICASELARRRREMIPGRTDPSRVLSAAVKETAARLGNTPAVCRASYISPLVIEAWREGQVISRPFQSVEELALEGHGLHASERSVLALLRGREAGRKPREPSRGADRHRAEPSSARPTCAAFRAASGAGPRRSRSSRRGGRRGAAVVARPVP
ncbi:MAG TPA: DNA topoisomerase IB [Anaeromyxobacteraceae bacterium]|nr:DNA topoisomerase IB [Anaeromyxobacteraceae bacterium]